MTNIILKILSHQNTNNCRVFVSATSGHSAVFREDIGITEVTIRYEGGAYKSSMQKINRLLFDEGFYFDSCEPNLNEYTFKKK